MLGKSTVRKDGKVLRVGSDPTVESNWETCTITDRACPRHIHSVPTNKKTDLNFDSEDENETVTAAEYGDNAENPKAKIEALMKAIEEGVDSVIESGEIENLLAHMGQFHNYSFGNQMLIYIQKPEAKEVAGYNRWEEMGRQVIKGERGIEILAPVMIKKKKEEDDGTIKEETFTRFRVVRVFDVSQTEPALYEFKDQAELDAFTKEWEDKGYTVTKDDSKPFSARITSTPKSPAKLLEGQAPPQMKSFVLEKIQAEGVSIQYGNVGGNANGASWKDETTGEIKISVRDDVSEAQQVKTLTHELMHVKLGHLDRMDEYHTKDGGHRGEMEVAVEALSFMVGNHFGLDTGDYSHGYMAGWARSNKGKLKEVLEKDVIGFFKEFMNELPKQETEALPMGTAATRRREFKAKRGVSNKKTWRNKKR